jgi:hypothetical protein
MFRMRIKRSFEIYPVLFKGISIGWVNCYIKNIPSLRFLPHNNNNNNNNKSELFS